MDRDESGFLERAEEARKIAFSFSDPLIVHHYDADGLSSGAIVAGAFLKEGRRFRRECVKKLDDGSVERLLHEKEVIFVDLGGGFNRVNELQDVVIIDHHQTQGVEKFQLNPLLHGLDGGAELSASGTAFCAFRRYNDLAVVGAVGDMQSPMVGMNRWVLEEGVKAGEVKVEEDLRFYGRYSRPLVQFLAYSDDPYLPGITFREDKAQELLSDLGITAEGKVYCDLGVEDKRRMISTLADMLIGANQLRKTNELVGESYIFPNHPKDGTFEANDFSTLLNACGRHDKADIGVKVCLGDPEAKVEAERLLAIHRRMLRDGIAFASGHVQDFGAFQFLDGRGIIDEGIIGIVCGMSIQQRWAKPIIGIALGEKGTIKFSARSPKSVVAAGVNLGDMMKRCSQGNGGFGGGHRMAAGASVPVDKLNAFLVSAGEYLRGIKA